MSPSPADLSNGPSVENYGTAWAALMQLVRRGHSWSGHERNCCYLNDGAGRFANVSYVSGLDFSDDGRAIAVVDWDQDGDLDLWFRNRTAPRLRLMLNLHGRGNGNFVAVKLEGTTSNRDGIGAVVEIIPGHDSEASRPRLVKSVHAGGLFLSQSSKWVHFGLAGIDRIKQAIVLWPGGHREAFGQLVPGNRYVLKQGTGTAEPWRPRSTPRTTDLLGTVETAPRTTDFSGAVETAPSATELSGAVGTAPSATELSAAVPTATSPHPGSVARIILPRKIPLPELAYRSPAGEQKILSRSSGPRLILIWASWCPHCRKELKSLSQAADTIRAAGLDLLALSLDDLDRRTGNDTAKAYSLIDQLKFPFPWGLIDSRSLERIQLFQEALFDKTVTTTVPLAFLLDRNANVTAIYRGPFALQSVLQDAASTTGASNEELHHLAPPLAGRWFTNHVDDATMAEFMARQFQTRLPEDSLPYLHLAVERSRGEKKAQLRREASTKNHLLARQYRRQQKPEQAAFYFDAALQYSPNSAEIHHDYGTMLGSYGLLREAEEQFRQALALEPDFKPARDSLELLRKLLKEKQ